MFVTDDILMSKNIYFLIVTFSETLPNARWDNFLTVVLVIKIYITKPFSYLHLVSKCENQTSKKRIGNIFAMTIKLKENGRIGGNYERSGRLKIDADYRVV